MLKQIFNLLEQSYAEHYSDIHLAINQKPAVRRNGKIHLQETMPLTTKETLQSFILHMLATIGIKQDNGKDIDLSFSHKNNRYRVNIYTKQGERAVAIRVLHPTVPTLEKMQLPEIFKSILDNKNGLILVTGPTGCGKSTTLAAMVNHLNLSRCMHILTFEDPIEFLFRNEQSIVSQREIGKDVDTFANALRSSLREDPDVIMVGEMRDLETIGLALTAAETGHLVLSSLHTIGAAQTIDRIIDVFPPHHQSQIRTQLSNSLRAVISQVLLPKAHGEGQVAAFEIMIVNQAISSAIKKGKTSQISSSIQTGVHKGMITLEQSVYRLIENQVINPKDATSYLNGLEI